MPNVPNDRVNDGSLPPRTIAALILATLFGLLGLIWLIEGNNFFLLKFFAPRLEQVRYDTFKEGRAYNEGTLQELSRLQREYTLGDAATKAKLAPFILQEFAGYDESKLPLDKQQFLQDLRGAVR